MLGDQIGSAVVDTIAVQLCKRGSKKVEDLSERRRGAVVMICVAAEARSTYDDGYLLR